MKPLGQEAPMPSLPVGASVRSVNGFSTGFAVQGWKDCPQSSPVSLFKVRRRLRPMKPLGREAPLPSVLVGTSVRSVNGFSTGFAVQGWKALPQSSPVLLFNVRQLLQKNLLLHSSPVTLINVKQLLYIIIIMHTTKLHHQFSSNNTK